MCLEIAYWLKKRAIMLEQYYIQHATKNKHVHTHTYIMLDHSRHTITIKLRSWRPYKLNKYMMDGSATLTNHFISVCILDTRWVFFLLFCFVCFDGVDGE